jgi:hypothetical protein
VGCGSSGPPTKAGKPPASLLKILSVLRSSSTSVSSNVIPAAFANLGNGRALADAVGGNGQDALMFDSVDGVCGLAFPARVAAAAGFEAVFVNEVGGDYPLSASPDLTGGSGPASPGRLEAMAAASTNVHVELPSGDVVATPGATVPILPVKLMDPRPDCRRFPCSPTPS